MSQTERGEGNDGASADPAATPRPGLNVWLQRRMKAYARFEQKLPAHPGLKALALLFAVAGVAGVVTAGRVDEVLTGASDVVGLSVGEVGITGQMETSEVAVLDKLQLSDGASLPLVDVAAARARIETLPWVQTATLRKVYPSMLKITIDERTPYALWQHDQTLSVIDDTGKVIGDASDAHSYLVRLVGEGAQLRAAEALALADAVPDIRARLRAAVLVGKRRWDFVLDNGVTLMLPQDDPKGALARIAAYQSKDDLLSRDIVAVDLRLDDRMYVRMTPEAADRRTAELKERDKLAKRKGANT